MVTRKASKTRTGKIKTSSKSSTTTRTTNGSSHGSASTGDALSVLVQHHDKMRSLIKKIEAHSGKSRDMDVLRELCLAWNDHAAVESRVAFPFFEEAGVDPALIHKTAIRGDVITVLVGDLISRNQKDPYFEPVVGVLTAELKKTMDAEEDDANGLYAKARSAEFDQSEFAEALREASTSTAEWDMGPRLLKLRARKQDKEVQNMRGTERERDERGRFVDDEDRGRRSSQSRQYSGRGSSRYESSRYEDEGPGWHGDPRGHSEASRRGWDERRESRGRDYDDDRRSRSDEDYDDRRRYRGRADDDERGGYRSRSYDDDDRRGRRTGGWFGDSEGHSEASRRGWDDPDHGPSGWYGDSEGHREASRRGWDNPDHGPSGWFGDPEGHSEASRRGWDDRSRGSSRRR